MKRFGMVCGLKPDKIEDYIKYHATVYHERPEVIAMIKTCNIVNYSIYFKDGMLFSYFEYIGDNFEADMDKMAQDPNTQAWWDIVKPLMEPLKTRAEGEFWADMQEIFHTD